MLCWSHRRRRLSHKFRLFVVVLSLRRPFHFPLGFSNALQVTDTAAVIDGAESEGHHDEMTVVRHPTAGRPEASGPRELSDDDGHRRLTTRLSPPLADR